MLPRAAVLPRAYLTCRRGLAQRIAALWAYSAPGCADQPRRHSSGATPQSKERVEALISGAALIDGDPGFRHQVKRQGGRRKGGRASRDFDDEPALWELPRSQAGKPPTPPEYSVPDFNEQLYSTLELLSATQSEPRVDKKPAAIPPPVEEKAAANAPQIDEQAAADPPRVLRHDLLQQQRVAVQALGEPVEAIVIKNPNKLRRTREPLPMLEEFMYYGMPLRFNDMILKTDEPPADASETWKYIDELRPRDATVLCKRDVEKLIGTLVDSFTRDQLVSYANRPVQEKPDETPSYPWIVRLGPWKAAQDVQLGSLTPKRQLALLILKKRWKIEVQEQVESLGKMRVWLQPDVFQLISRSPKRILQTLVARYLDGENKEKIVPNSEESQLAIYSGKSTVPTLLTRIDAVARSLKSKKVSVKHIGNDSLSEAVLGELERVTHTYIRYNKNTMDLCVSWLADSNASQTEDPADVASRLLLDLKVAKKARVVQMVAPTARIQYGKPAHVEYHRERRSMSWRDKMRPWSRYASPIAKEPFVHGAPLDFPLQVVLPEEAFVETDAQTTNRIIATFGHVLHGKPTIRVTTVGKCRRILSPVVPHPASLTTLTAGSHKPVSQSTTIFLNFCPEPALLQHLGDAIARHLRLRLPVNPDSDLSALAVPPDPDLEAVATVQVNDILLPEESVDVRLVQEHLHPLDASQQPLRDFLAASKFNLLDRRLRTPSRVRLSVPTAWLSGTELPASLLAQESAELPYMFNGLEIHHAVDVEWHGCTLRYTSIDAGRHGGQRQEISLHTVVPGGPHPCTSRTQICNFLRLVQDIAVGKLFSWDQGYKLVQPRSKEPLDWDVMDEHASTSKPSV